MSRAILWLLAVALGGFAAIMAYGPAALVAAALGAWLWANRPEAQHHG